MSSINTSDIKKRLDAGTTEEEIAKLIANELNSTFEQARAEKAERAKVEAEQKAKKEKIAEARKTLVNALIAYYKALGYDVKAGTAENVYKWLSNCENSDFFDVSTWIKPLFNFLF